MELKYVGEIKKDGGVHQLPFKIRRLMYDLIKSIDLNEDDKMRAEGKYGMHQFDESPGIGAVVSNDKISFMINMQVYDPAAGLLTDEHKTMVVAVSRDDVECLLTNYN